MPSLARNSRPLHWLGVALPVIVAAWLRLRGIGELEPFVDEAGNILAALDLRVRAVVDPLGQGRPALAHLFAPAGWFPGEVLTTARLMSAGAGLATLAALGWMLHRLAGRTAALAGLWLWALLPFAVFHERLALQDPFVTALLAWAAALMSAGCGAEPKRAAGWFLGAGGLFGLAVLGKISAVFALAWLGPLYCALHLHRGRPVFNRGLAWIALGATLPLLALGASLGSLGVRSGQYGSLPDFAAGNYWADAWHRAGRWGRWLTGYGGWPLALLGVPALLAAVRARSRPALGGALGFLLALAAAALFYNRPFARYALPDQLPLVIFLALAWAPLLVAGRAARIAALLLLAVALGRWGYVDWRIGTEPAHAPIPADEINQYVTGPWSGHGLAGVRAYLAEYADRHQVRCLVLTHRFLRPGAYGLMLAELGDPRIGVVPFTIYEPAELAAARPGLLHAATGQRAAFFILYEGSLYPAHPWLEAAGSPARRVLEVPRGPGEQFTLYQFEP